MKAIEPAWHEFTANFLYAEYGLKPFFGSDAAVKEGNGSRVGSFRHDGERWVCRLYYQDSGIVPPDSGVTPTGTEWRLTEPREFRLSVSRHPDEDPTAGPHDDRGQQSFNAHLSPRWQGMETENARGERSEFSVPESITEAVNVRVNGSNIDAFRYKELLRLAFDSVGVYQRYFRDLHPYSNVQDAERYVRLHKNASGPIHARDGPIAGLAHCLESDRSGYRKLVQNDDDEHGRNLPGYYHTVTLDPGRVREVWPNHALPIELKHYYAKEALSIDDGPLKHPKLGASYQVSRWDGTLGATDDDLAQLRDELDEVVHSTLAAAGLDLSPSRGTGDYVPDAFFDADRYDRDPPMDLNVTEVRSEQESVVIRHVADGLSPVQWESLETLVADGGEVSPADIADANGRHVESVRRALRSMSDLVERKYGEVGLKSDHIADMVHDAVQQARNAVRKSVSTAAHAIDVAERGGEQAMAEWVAWCDRYGVDISNRADRLEIDLGDLDPHRDPNPARLVRRGFALWKDAHQDPARFRAALVRVNETTRSAFKFLSRTTGATY